MRLMPNLCGPGERKRRLYANIINSVVLYASPIWAHIANKKQIKEKMRRIKRHVALRVISAYRTVSHEASAILANQIPLDILANESARIYNAESGLREEGIELTPRMRIGIRNMQRSALIQLWKDILVENSNRLPGGRVRNCLVPILSDWMARGKELAMSFRTTQVITGHSCFNVYLYNIRKTGSSVCLHCERRIDTADHTLLECDSWTEERAKQVDAFGLDFTLKKIFEESLKEPSKWKVFTDYCEQVIRKKEEAK
ncbi:uncharacterized protein LOC120357376 [Solenopsis invicta]|uniref:uncharacterized protein LOC120357376 n=1 Tax=Solenopsis invicta TaxID=13686 RepID=UPI00193CB130|nr:uncharacterized protein LOC120357376 [Solenopsis invicta]